jgi:protein-S-isoprenylcysteine O-methyltransferase Ste14
VDETQSTQQPASPERRRFDNASPSFVQHELGHTKSPVSEWVAVYVIIAASVIGAFSLILGKWWMAWLAIGITVVAVVFAVVTTRAAKRSREGGSPAAEPETAPNVRASR